MAPQDRASHWDLEYLLSRLDRVFDRYEALPRHALLYRLCEVGPKPFDPRWVEHALSTLTAGRPLQGTPADSPAVALPAVTESAPGVFAPARADLTRVDSLPTPPASDAIVRAQAAMLGVHAGWSATAEAALAALADGVNGCLRKYAGGRPTVTLDDTSEATALGDGSTLSRPARVIRHAPRGARRRLHVWILHELPWLTPDDPRLWTRLAAAAADSATLLVVARKASRALFPVLQAVGAAVVQVWWHLADDGTSDLRSIGDAVGWLPLRAPADVGAHAVWDQLDTCLTHLDSQTPTESARRAAARDAALRRLAGIDAAHTPAALRGWADEIALNAPPLWVQTVAAWEALAAGELPPCPSPPLGGAPTPDAARRGKRADSAPAEDVTRPPLPRNPFARESDTVVTRSGIAAEVDWETWNRLKRGRQ